jgi:uncharacterized protein (TIGR02677 family)
MSYNTFSYLVADKAVLYRRIMAAFVEAKAHFTVHLRPEDVWERTGIPSLEEVQAALAQLVHWGNLEADPDTSRVTSVEEFYRARFLYQLTRAGEAVEHALQVFDRELGRRGALQAVALDDIRMRLRSLLELSRQESPDATQTQLLLRDLTHVFSDLAENARAFMSGLSRIVELRGDDQEALIAYKERLIGYIERFIGDLVTSSAEIAGCIRALDQHEAGNHPIVPLLRLAVEHELEDLAPDLKISLPRVRVGVGAHDSSGDSTPISQRFFGGSTPISLRPSGMARVRQTRYRGTVPGKRAAEKSVYCPRKKRYEVFLSHIS